MPTPPNLLASVEGLLDGQGTLADVERALATGADSNEEEAKLTALRRAVEGRHKSLVQLLLSSGADANVKDQKGVGALHLAAFDGSDDCISALLEASADANISDKHGQTPLFFASTPKTCELLIAGRADVHVMNNKQQSALHLAAHAGLHEIVRLFAEVGGQPLLDMQDKRGLTPYYYAARTGGKKSLGVLQSKGASKTLHMPTAVLDAAKQPKRKRLACEMQWGNMDFSELGPEVLASVTRRVGAAVAAEAGVGAENVHVVRQGAGGMRALVNLQDTAAADALAEVLGAPEFSSALAATVDGEVSGAFVSEFRVLPDAPKLAGLKSLGMAMSAPAKLLQMSKLRENVVAEEVEWKRPPTPPSETSEAPQVMPQLELTTTPPGFIEEETSALFDLQESKIVSPDDIISTARTSELCYPMMRLTEEPEAPVLPAREAEVPLVQVVEPPQEEKAVAPPREPEPALANLREPDSPLKSERSAGSAFGSVLDRALKVRREPSAADECTTWDVVLEKSDGTAEFGFAHMDGKRSFERLVGDGELSGPEHLVVACVAHPGVLQRWNLQHPEAEVRRHDRVCGVNGETTVSGMQSALRGSVARMQLLRFPERIVLQLPRGERGFTSEPSGSGLRIKELAPDGPVSIHNTQQVALGHWHNVVHSGMHIIAVNETVADPIRLVSELRTNSSARLVLLRGRPTAQAQLPATTGLPSPQGSRPLSRISSSSSRPMSRFKSERSGCECWIVTLEKTQEGDELGFATLNAREEFQRRTNGSLQGPEALVVWRIRPGALLERWNREHPETAVMPQDRICNVNSEISVEGMQHELRARRVRLRMVRYPERFNVTFTGDALGCSLEPAEEGSVRITEIAQQGAVHTHNLQQISQGLWQFAVLPGMLLECDSAQSVVDELAAKEEVTLVVQRCDRARTRSVQAHGKMRMFSRLTKLRSSAPEWGAVDRRDPIPSASSFAARSGSPNPSSLPPGSPVSAAPPAIGGSGAIAAIALEEFTPGAYILAQRAVVAPSVAPCSPQDVVAELPAGMPIRVLEVVALTDIDRVRGRLAEPHGWISLQNLEDGFQWARKLEQELDDQDHDSESMLC